MAEQQRAESDIQQDSPETPGEPARPGAQRTRSDPRILTQAHALAAPIQVPDDDEEVDAALLMTDSLNDSMSETLRREASSAPDPVAVAAEETARAASGPSGQEPPPLSRVLELDRLWSRVVGLTTELHVTRVELAGAKEELELMRTSLEGTQDELRQARAEQSTLQQALISVQADVTHALISLARERHERGPVAPERALPGSVPAPLPAVLELVAPGAPSPGPAAPAVLPVIAPISDLAMAARERSGNNMLLAVAAVAAAIVVAALVGWQVLGKREPAAARNDVRMEVVSPAPGDRPRTAVPEPRFESLPAPAAATAPPVPPAAAVPSGRLAEGTLIPAAAPAPLPPSARPEASSAAAPEAAPTPAHAPAPATAAATTAAPATAVAAPAAPAEPAPPPAPPAARPTPAAPVAASPAASAAAGTTGGPAKVAPDPAAYRRLIAEAERRAQQGQRAQALGLYQKALLAQPGGVDALAGLGYVSLDMGRRREAGNWFRQALRRVPSHGESLIGLGEALKGEGKTAAALDAYRRYVTYHPQGRDAGMARRNIEELGARVTSPPADGASPSE
jgi:hypothetical protein